MTTTTTTAPRPAQKTATRATATAPKSAPKSGRAPSKAEVKETEVKLTKAQQTKLDTLISATKDGIKAYSEADKQADEFRVSADRIKVYSARSVALLAAHPAMIGTRGPKAGQPAITKVATATGYAAATIEPLWKAAMALTKAGWQNRTKEPATEELALVRGFIKSANDERYDRENGKTKSNRKKPAPKAGSGVGTKVTFATLQGQLKALREATAKFTADNGFTVEQADDLQAGLDELHDVIEQATAGRKSESAA